MRVYNWTHKPWCRPSDPINVIFRNVNLHDIERFLSDPARNWRVVGSSLSSKLRNLAPDQVIPDPDPINKRPQDLQLLKPIKGLFRRYHIRLWKLQDCIIANIHLDALRATGHTATDFESIEMHFADICKQNPNWTVDMDAEDMDNRISGYGQPFNNGRATVVKSI
jgi:hypothetical protein